MLTIQKNEIIFHIHPSLVRHIIPSLASPLMAAVTVSTFHLEGRHAFHKLKAFHYLTWLPKPFNAQNCPYVHFLRLPQKCCFCGRPRWELPWWRGDLARSRCLVTSRTSFSLSAWGSVDLLYRTWEGEPACADPLGLPVRCGGSGFKK